MFLMDPDPARAVFHRSNSIMCCLGDIKWRSHGSEEWQAAKPRAIGWRRLLVACGHCLALDFIPSDQGWDHSWVALDSVPAGHCMASAA